MTDPHIRPLVPADAPAYTALRREMLRDSPWAFAASPGDDFALDPVAVAARLADPGYAIVGAFEGGDARGETARLVGSAGLSHNRHIKMAHRAHIWGVYISPPSRGRGLGSHLMTATLDLAASWPGVTSVGLSVSVRSHAAIRLYQRLGFVQWGLEPGALILDGHAYDEIHMAAVLDKRG
jgi:RimJ/RimL family protein N-acetyltransferase